MTLFRCPSFFFVCWFLLFSVSPMVSGQETSGQRTVTVIGDTSVAGKDAAAARQQAIADALATAVEISAVEMLGPDETVARFDDLNQIILENEKAFIQTYEVLSGGTTLQKRFRIPVRVTVSAALIRERLDAMRAEAPPEPETKSERPRLLILVAEQQTERGTVHYWWREEEQPVAIASGQAMAQVLSEEGYAVIPHGALFQDPETVARIRFNPYIEPGDAAVVGRNLSADVVIVGTAVARRSLNVMGEALSTFSATVSVRAFSTKTGEEIAKVARTGMESKTDPAAGRRAALEKAGNMCAAKLADQLDAAWGGAAVEEGLRLIVGGTRNLGNFVMFRRELRNIAGVHAIRLQEMRTNEAVLQIDYDGDGAALAQAIEKKRFETFSLKLYNAAPGEVRIELVAP